MNQNYIFDENNNLILENNNNYVIGDIIVIDNKNEYEITFIDEQNNLAYAEYNGSYNDNEFKSRYKSNIIVFSCLFIVFLLTIFFLAFFYKLKLHKKRNKNLKHH